ncbi:two-component system chemotaxis response regulator CheV [Lacrimispora xylanisolvens]|jgi:two-component system chemotaxis response regulator CheV|uniref:Stage 0 sporulation protein A homolog n=1 Tax=Lacrimispora xylanisolvens TaxID=384636 RepID=A0A2S6HMV2_9FIRM|nr:chemotaxis protein [Hungatella xylanolytica]MBE5988538.1 chemotaxis signal transduction protein CheV [Paenibacillaceae bacterium]PPK78698.1 two-component system chemotaxis response regulator CheV [Hungatella xylanolytica]
MAETEILLESGTNEIEIMEFTIYGELYGINVAKVREIMMSDKVKPIPHAHPAVEGIFKPRDLLLTVIDLPYYLTGSKGEKQGKDLFIITNFNKLHIAFRVHSVVGISRISWKNIQKPDDTISRGDEGVATGIAQCGTDLVTILDFEKIVADIAPETGIQIDDINKLGKRTSVTNPILIAEDSILLTKMIEAALRKAGYENLTFKNNGQEAWNYLSQIRDDSDLDEKVSLIITDIEMPEMDGHRLTKLVKEDKKLKHIPLVIFSSMINQELMIKGKQLGADEQLSKPEIAHLVEVIDHLLQRRKTNG